MGLSVTAKLLAAHAVNGVPAPGQEIMLRIDETLLQDATGTMVMLELEAMGITGTKVSRSVQYVDHNLLQGDVNNANDQRFLASAARRFGVWYSPAGNGISHVVHMQRFGAPGRLLLGSDSHTCAAGALGMFGIGMGGLDVAQAMAGSPLRLPMPRIRQIWLTGTLSKWTSAKDVILALLRRHGVAGGVGWVFEYDGPGLAALSVTDRYVIANMGAEIGATASIFPSDGETRRYLREQGREQDWTAMTADPDAGHDEREELDLSSIPPLIALPSSPGNVVEVAEVAGRQVDQVVVGSSANPGLRDFSVVAAVLANTTKSAHVSLEINPSSRRTLGELTRSGALLDLINAGGRIHQAGCLGCVGIGQVPGTGMVSLRTMPRNFPGRSGNAEDQVYLCSPETAAAAALRGVITDPRELGEPPSVPHYERGSGTDFIFVAPSADTTGTSTVHKPPNIGVIPAFDPLPDALDAPALLLVGDDISTDDIIPGGAEAMPLRSNIERSAAFTFRPVDPTFYQRALAEREHTGGFIVAGANYGQGSSREHAALLPRFLGIHAVIALSFARIHRQNLINFGVVPLTVDPASDGVPIIRDDRLRVERLRERIAAGAEQIVIDNVTQGKRVLATVELSDWQRRVLLSGGVMNELRESPVPSEDRQSITVSPA